MKWHPDGKMLATASKDKKTQLVDFGTGKVIYTGMNSKEGIFTSLDSIVMIFIYFFDRECVFSMFRLMRCLLQENKNEESEKL